MTFTNEKLFKIFKDNLILIIACGLLCFGIAFAYSKFYVKPIYYSDSKIMIESNNPTETTTTVGITKARMLVDTYLQMLDSNDFYEKVRTSLSGNLKNKYTTAQIMEWTTLTVQGETEVIKIRFNCLDKDDAQIILQNIVSKIPESVNFSFYQTNVKIVESPLKPVRSNDKTVMFSVVGFIFGLALVYGIAVLREALDIRVKNIKDLVERYDLPVLGSIPAFKGKVIKKEDGING
ncbi:MAG TPA: hypothetical protein DCP51_03665 [Clostridiales bacterium]|nr:hypothetical protein [Clostridiales bacterium]